jgi:very-short-patch-repair endonuclease
LQKEYASGVRDRKAITQKANEKTRQLYAEGKGVFQRPEVKEKMQRARLASAKWWYAITEGRRGDKNPLRKHPASAKRASDKLQAFLKANPDRHGNRAMGRAVMAGHAGYISKGHRKLYNCAQQLELGSVEVEFPIKTLDKNFYADVAFPELKIALEFDGSYWHQDEEKDRLRDEALATVGWKTLRYRDVVPALSALHSDVSRVMANHKGEYIFTSVTVDKVERWKLRKARRLYNFSVLGDESYIAKGFVVHNCRSLVVPILRTEGPVTYITPSQVAKGVALSGKGFCQEHAHA